MWRKLMLNKELLDYIKHLTDNDTKSLSQKALKAAEEVGELAKCVLPYDNAAGTTHRFITKSKILEEVSDTLLTVLSVAYELDFTDEDIEQMVNHKTKKWADLQAREGRVKYPIPYEIHVTVDVESYLKRFSGGTPEIFLDDIVEVFCDDCEVARVKPILLDLHLKNGAVFKDLMTSSTFMGDNRGAYQEMKRISDTLKHFNWKVVREKIETIPWHPAAPSKKHEQPIMPPNCYFECHFNVITPVVRMEELDELAKRLHFHKSRNILKKITDDIVTTMVTHRRYGSPYEDVRHDIDNFKKMFEDSGFEIEKEIVEFSIYDSKVSHDAAWITGE
jgi:NTP pyrophosphatase (non-canonical NTP hydrolase)